MLCAYCSGWVFRLWILAGAVCCAYSGSPVSIINTPSLCGNRRALCICLMSNTADSCSDSRLNQSICHASFNIYWKYLKHWCQCCLTHSSVEYRAVSRIFLARSHLKSVELASDNEQQTYKRLRIEVQNRKQQAFLLFFFHPLISMTYSTGVWAIMVSYF